MKNLEYPVFAKWYETVDWILTRCEGFPKDVRFTISNRISNLALDVLERITEAIYTKNRTSILRAINLMLEKLRILFRLCFDRRYLSFSQYEHVSKAINETGKMVGGWTQYETDK
jgi:hypothetical protein